MKPGRRDTTHIDYVKCGASASQICNLKDDVVLGGIQVRYRKSPRDTCRTVKLKLTLTLVLTLTDTGGAVLTIMLGYRSLYITWQ